MLSISFTRLFLSYLLGFGLSRPKQLWNHAQPSICSPQKVFSFSQNIANVEAPACRYFMLVVLLGFSPPKSGEKRWFHAVSAKAAFTRYSRQIQANAILNMSLIELQQFIETEAVENPALSVKEGNRCPICGFVTGEKACPVCGASMKAIPEVDNDKMGERDYLERAYAAAGMEATFDPFRTVARRRCGATAGSSPSWPRDRRSTSSSRSTPPTSSATRSSCGRCAASTWRRTLLRRRACCGRAPKPRQRSPHTWSRSLPPAVVVPADTPSRSWSRALCAGLRGVSAHWLRRKQPSKKAQKLSRGCGCCLCCLACHCPRQSPRGSIRTPVAAPRNGAHSRGGAVAASAGGAGTIGARVQRHNGDVDARHVGRLLRHHPRVQGGVGGRPGRRQGRRTRTQGIGALRVLGRGLFLRRRRWKRRRQRVRRQWQQQQRRLLFRLRRRRRLVLSRRGATVSSCRCASPCSTTRCSGSCGRTWRRCTRPWRGRPTRASRPGGRPPRSLRHHGQLRQLPLRKSPWIRSKFGVGVAAPAPAAAAPAAVPGAAAGVAAAAPTDAGATANASDALALPLSLSALPRSKTSSGFGRSSSFSVNFLSSYRGGGAATAAAPASAPAPAAAADDEDAATQDGAQHLSIRVSAGSQRPSAPASPQPLLRKSASFHPLSPTPLRLSLSSASAAAESEAASPVSGGDVAPSSLLVQAFERTRSCCPCPRFRPRHPRPARLARRRRHRIRPPPQPPLQQRASSSLLQRCLSLPPRRRASQHQRPRPSCCRRCCRTYTRRRCRCCGCCRWCTARAPSCACWASCTGSCWRTRRRSMTRPTRRPAAPASSLPCRPTTSCRSWRFVLVHAWTGETGRGRGRGGPHAEAELLGGLHSRRAGPRRRGLRAHHPAGGARTD